ncbi:MAG TPA: transporter substrate-binding domain-containing protein [Casimicrobiaceae bacterium]|nr:transporter substrate-binding domain-containing protein [Casimicrobiaceae bacterium]
MSIDSRRGFIRGLGGLALAALATRTAVAQQPTSTWDQIKQRGELRIGVTPGEPWFYKDPATGAWSGIGYAMGQQVAKDLGVKLVPVETTWGNAVAAIQANQIDVMFVLDPTDERKKAIDFPDAPFFWYAEGVLVRDGLPSRSWADLDKKDVKLAVTLGTAPDRDVTKRLPNARIDRFQNMDEAIASFYSGRVDGAAFYHPALVMQQARVKKGEVVIPQPVVALATSAGIRREDDKRFRDFLSKEFDKYYKDGTTQKFYEQFLASRHIDPKKAPPIIKEQWK